MRNAYTRKESNRLSEIDRLYDSMLGSLRSSFVRKYKGKRNGRAIELTRPSLAHTHTHTETFSRVFRDILITFSVKEKERDKERERNCWPTTSYL